MSCNQCLENIVEVAPLLPLKNHAILPTLPTDKIDTLKAHDKNNNMEA